MPWSISQTRIFVALTLAEAAAIGRLTANGDAEASAALAKIQTALDGARTEASRARPQPSRSRPVDEPPTLRAKHYAPRARQRPMAKAALRRAPPTPTPP